MRECVSTFCTSLPPNINIFFKLIKLQSSVLARSRSDKTTPIFSYQEEKSSYTADFLRYLDIKSSYGTETSMIMKNPHHPLL